MSPRAPRLVRLGVLALLAPAAPGCLEDDPVTVDDVIPRFQPLAPEESRIADGRTPIAIEVCRDPDPGTSRTLAATLRTSAGRWQLGEADARTAVVPMSSPCEIRLLQPPAEPGTLTVTATIDSFTRALPITLRAAPVERVRLARQGSLSPTAGSMLTLTASVDVAGGGVPSVGTLVTFDVTVEAPAGAGAYVTEREVRIAQGASVQTTLFVTEGVTHLTATAVAAPAEQPAVGSAPLLISQ